MAKKKKVSAEEKSKVSSARRAKCLKELEKENENVAQQIKIRKPGTD